MSPPASPSFKGQATKQAIVKWCIVYHQVSLNGLRNQREKNDMHTSSTQLQNRLFHIAESMRTLAKSTNMKNARSKHAKTIVSHN